MCKLVYKEQNFSLVHLSGDQRCKQSVLSHTLSCLWNRDEETGRFTPNWTEEVFQVSLVKHTNPITYSLEDLRGEPIKDSFYEQELQATDQQIFHIERVLRRQGQRAYVKWWGYSNAFNLWVPLQDLI